MVVPMKGIMYEMHAMNYAQMPIPDGRKEPCMDLELNAMECLEAYGMAKGTLLCKQYIEDMQECKVARIRSMRAIAMRMERAKKLAKGEIPWEKRWGKPYNYNSYVAGTFMP